MSGKTFKRQTFHGEYTARGSEFGSWTPGSKTYYEQGSIASLTHPGFRKRLGKGDCGGAFYLIKTREEVQPAHLNNALYQGPIWPLGPQGVFTSFTAAPENNSTLQASGTTAIARTLPDNPVGGLAQFLGELHEGLPRTFGRSLTRERAAYFKGLGDEYLNYQFGWVPFVSDIRKFAFAIKHSNRIINGYRKGSGSSLHRRYDFPTTVESNSDSFRLSMSGTVTTLSMNGTASSSLTKERWFEGAFKYHVPVGESHLDKMRRYESYASKVLGLNLNPELVWELTPWSWLVDWQSNIGDIIHNISYIGKDGTVLEYGYIMNHARSVLRYDAIRPVDDRYPQGASSYSFIRDYKQRLPATPFGFSLNPGGFSKKQLAILAALGLSRGGKPWNENSDPFYFT